MNQNVVNTISSVLKVKLLRISITTSFEYVVIRQVEKCSLYNHYIYFFILLNFLTDQVYGRTICLAITVYKLSSG